MSPIELSKHFIHELSVYCSSTSNSLVDYDSKCVYYSKVWYNLYNKLFFFSKIILFFNIKKIESANRNFDLELNTPNDLAPLPVNLCKYRLNVKPNIDAQAITTTAATTSQISPILLLSDNESVSTPIYPYNNDSSDSSLSSERSSYCEYVEPEPKKTPEYIVINSSSSSSSEADLFKSKRKSRKKDRTDAHCSKEDGPKNRSQSSEEERYKSKIRKKSKKKSKHKKQHGTSRSYTPTSKSSRSRSRDHHHRKKKKKRNKSKK